MNCWNEKKNLDNDLNWYSRKNIKHEKIELLPFDCDSFRKQLEQNHNYEDHSTNTEWHQNKYDSFLLSQTDLWPSPCRTSVSLTHGHWPVPFHLSPQ